MAKNITKISGHDNGVRVDSRVMEMRIQEAVANGARNLEIDAYGQHGIGGRLWVSKDEPITIKLTGAPGQRTGSMGFPNTRIEIMGPGSDDIGWLNAGADIIVHGNASNGACNAMAQGKVYVEGSIGARGMTMTKTNPRFAPPELWVLGSTGDYFAEFMAGGTAVVCGVEPKNPENVLGFRPCVGMVGGRIFVRGPHKGFSFNDAKLRPITDEDWAWLTESMKDYLAAIGKSDLYDALTIRDDWQLITARSPLERTGKKRRSMKEYHMEVWDAELGAGGMIGDLTDLDRSPIPLVVNGEMRRFVPVWENKKFQAPCQSACPSGIPVQERWRLVRDGLVDEAVDLALSYSPFPATVCGYLCPNLCMQGCTRSTLDMAPVDITVLGRQGLSAKAPDLPELTGKRVAVIGGGPGGISAAWQLRLKGHEAIIYDIVEVLGGKIASAIPESRIPKEVLDTELERIREVLPLIHMQQDMHKEQFEQLCTDYDSVVIAAGANKPRSLPVPGKEKLIPALSFLQEAKQDKTTVGKRVVIIGAGNVGCDVATEAHRLGAEDILLIDVQTPAAFGKEKEEAEHVGAKFKWPCFTKEITDEGVVLTDGEVLPADTVIVSIGDQPNLDFITDDIATDRGHIKVNEQFQTTKPQVYAVGDIVKPGLLTEAIGAGRKAAEVIDDIFRGVRPETDSRQMVETEQTSQEYFDPAAGETRQVIDYTRMTLEYFDPRIESFSDVKDCAEECSSCGSCRDCGLCETICPEGAIHRVAKGKDFEMVSNPDRCIGCGFCACACPCGIWNMMENTPLG